MAKRLARRVWLIAGKCNKAVEYIQTLLQYGGRDMPFPKPIVSRRLFVEDRQGNILTTEMRAAALKKNDEVIQAWLTKRTKRT